MKKSLSRAISAVLATCMTLSVLPSAAVAAEKVYSYKSIETVSDGLSFTADYAKGSSGWGTQTYICLLYTSTVLAISESLLKKAIILPPEKIFNTE